MALRDLRTPFGGVKDSELDAKVVLKHFTSLLNPKHLRKALVLLF